MAIAPCSNYVPNWSGPYWERTEAPANARQLCDPKVSLLKENPLVTTCQQLALES